jgi:hypothetical protein
LLIAGDAGSDYAILASTNLTDWQTVFTTNPPAMPFRWTNMSQTNRPAFYRALQTP